MKKRFICCGILVLLIFIVSQITYADAEFSLVNPLKYDIAFGGDGPVATYGADWFKYGDNFNFKDKVLICEPKKDENGNYQRPFSGYVRLGHNTRPGIVKGKMIYEFSLKADNLRLEEGGTANFNDLPVGRLIMPFEGYDANGRMANLVGFWILHEAHNDKQYALQMFVNGDAPYTGIDDDHLLAMIDFDKWYTVRIEVNMYQKYANYIVREEGNDEIYAIKEKIPLSNGAVNFNAAAPYCGNLQVQNSDIRLYIKKLSYTVEIIDVKDIKIKEENEQIIATALCANDTAYIDKTDSPSLVLVVYDSLGRVIDIGMDNLTGVNGLKKRDTFTTIPKESDYQELSVTLQKPSVSYTCKAFVVKNMDEIYPYMSPVNK